MKKFLGLFLFCFLANFLFAELQTLGTKYFLIVYDSEVSEQAAIHLAENADKIAEELFTYFKVKPFKSRMPVYIKPNEEQLNAYYTGKPYAHIVLYDSLPTDNIIANNSESLLSVFKHELTHAVTIKGLLSLTFPLPMREGPTVLSESLKGEGRLNDPRTMQMIVQDKIDGTLRKWNDIEMRDTYPTANFGYIYGGAFAKFITDIYGAEKYADFFRVYPKWFTTYNFKLAFGKTVDELFEAFYTSVKVPENVLEPKYFLDKKIPSTYETTASYKNEFIVFDKNKNAVYSYDINSGKRKKLFSLNKSIYNLSFSSDGNFLLVSYFKYKNGSTLSELKVYDYKAKKFTSEKYESLRYASLTPNLKNIIAVKNTSQNAELILLDRTTKSEKSIFKCTPETNYSNIYNVIAISDTDFVAILGNGIKRDIVFVSESGVTQKLSLPFEAKMISALSNAFTENPSFSFSYILDDSLLRMAYYDVTTKTLKVLNKNFSGGTNNPVLIDNKNKTEKNFITVANHSTHDFLCELSENELETVESTLQDIEIKRVREINTNHESKKYNPFMYMWKPWILPAIYQGTNLKNTSYGLNLSSQDAINRLAYNFSFAIMPIPTFAQLEFIGSLKVNGNILSLFVKDNIEDIITKNEKTTGIRKTGFGFNNANKLLVNKTKITFNTNIGSFWFASIDLNLKNAYKQKFTDTVLALDQSIGVLHFTERDRLDQKFFAKDIYGVANNFNFAFAYNVQKKLPALQVQDAITFKTPVVPLTLELSADISFNSSLNPITGTYAFANSPSYSTKALLPKMDEHHDYYTAHSPQKLNTDFGVVSTLQIFSVEIQKGSVWLPICYNRFNIDIGYKALIKSAFSSDWHFLQSAFASMSLTLNGIADIGLTYSHPILKEAKIGSISLLSNLRF